MGGLGAMGEPWAHQLMQGSCWWSTNTSFIQAQSPSSEHLVLKALAGGKWSCFSAKMCTMRGNKGDWAEPWQEGQLRG